MNAAPATGGALTDAQIAQKTNIEEVNGRLKFTMTLPSGREVEGSFSAGSRSGAIVKWCEAVNAAIATDQEEDKLRQKRALQLAEAEKQSQLVLPAGLTPAMPMANGPAVVTTDPIAFIKQSLEAAEKAAAYWQNQAADAARKSTQAQFDLERWRQLHATLVPAGSSDGPAGDSTDTADADE